MPLRVERSVDLKLLLGTIPLDGGVKLVAELKNGDEVWARWLDGPVFAQHEDAQEAIGRAVLNGVSLSTEGEAEWRT